MPTLQLLNSLHKVRTEIRAKRKEYVLALQIADIELQILLDLRQMPNLLGQLGFSGQQMHSAVEIR